MARSILAFLAAVVHHWEALLTGGAIVALLGVWTYTGHTVQPLIHWCAVALALLPSCFQAWKEQRDRAELAEQRTAELAGRPDLSLRCAAVKPAKVDAKESGAVRAETTYGFTVRNSGSVQAVNVSIDGIVLPMSKSPQRNMGDLASWFRGQANAEPGGQRPGWDTWTVVFERLPSVSSGQQLPIPFRIDNMGPLQNRDICGCLESAARPDALAPLALPLSLRFSNRDGSRWVQRYDLLHELPSRLTLVFKGIERESD